MKKLLIALVVVVALCLATAVPVMADSVTTPGGPVFELPGHVDLPSQAIDNSPVLSD